MSKTDVKNLELSEKITVLKEYLDNLKEKPKKYRKEYESCFRSLNSVNRYPYYWDLSTTTNAKFIQFLLMTKRFLNKSNDMDDLVYITDNYLPKMSRSYMTMYLIFKTYNKHREELSDIKFPFKKVNYKIYENYMNDEELFELEKIKKYTKKKIKAKEEIENMDLW